mmetsp:Transcript_4333/g.6651  ORF Transcript_4333/g.6651 Transcript_4333/m.6651 type:complete len:228 (-) Transcript_4333:4-687(-)
MKVSSSSSLVLKPEKSASTLRTETSPKISALARELLRVARYSSRVYVGTSGSASTSGSATHPTASAPSSPEAVASTSMSSFTACSASLLGLPQLAFPAPPFATSFPRPVPLRLSNSRFLGGASPFSCLPPRPDRPPLLPRPPPRPDPGFSEADGADSTTGAGAAFDLVWFPLFAPLLVLVEVLEVDTFVNVSSSSSDSRTEKKFMTYTFSILRMMLTALLMQLESAL